jgi:voltage-gated potassium channel
MTTLHPLFGMNGLSRHDSERALVWERRLRWLLIPALLLTIPAFYIELGGGVANSGVVPIGHWMYLPALLVMGAQVGILLMRVKSRAEYLRHNWMDLVIALGTLANLLFMASPWTPLEWTLRIGLEIAVFLRLLGYLHGLLTPGGLIHILLIAAAVLAAAGAGFYWLEPSVSSYGEGLWLAFSSAATVGYGDYYPTTPASRIFSVFIVLLGYAVLSLVTATIAALFIGEEEKELRRELHHDMRALRNEITELQSDLRALRSEKTTPD